MKGSMERVLYTDVKMMYPKKWILLVNMKKAEGKHCSSGEIYWVSDSRNEIFEKAMEIKDDFDRTMVVEGFDDTPRIGGLVW